MSDGFSTDVDALRRGANLFLDAAIDDLSTARSKLDSTREHDQAFDGGEDFFAEVRDRWDEMRHYFDRVFGDNITNLALSQEALLEIARRYEGVDNASAKAVRG